MSKMSELDADRQQIERLTDVVRPPSFAETARAGAPTHYSSLKAAIPAIAGILGCSCDALYERQRELVRKRLLPTPSGRGLGSGAPFRSDYLYLLVAAALFSERLSALRDAAPLKIRSLAKSVGRAIVMGEAASCYEQHGAIVVCRSIDHRVTLRLLQVLAAVDSSEAS